MGPRSESMDGQTKERQAYEAPRMKTLSGKELLETLGPAVAGYGQPPNPF